MIILKLKIILVMSPWAGRSRRGCLSDQTLSTQELVRRVRELLGAQAEGASTRACGGAAGRSRGRVPAWLAWPTVGLDRGHPGGQGAG